MNHWFFRFLAAFIALMILILVGIVALLVWHDVHPASFRAWWCPWALGIPLAGLHIRLTRWIQRQWYCEKGGAK